MTQRRKLGRRPSRFDARTVKFADLFVDKLPDFPMAMNKRDNAVPDRVSDYGNNDVGDCTIASIAHLEEVWTENGRLGRLLTTEEVLAFYSLVTGYVPGDDTTDNGADMLTVLKRWRKDGVGGKKIVAFVQIDHNNVEHVKSAINLLGGVYVGAELRTSAQQPGPWIGRDVRGDVWGGHCMSASRYDRSGGVFRTWGDLQPFDWDWWLRSVDECYGVISVSWFRGERTPNGLDMLKLRSYLLSL